MGKLAIVGTVKTAPGKRDEYLKHLKAHAQRSLATEPGTLEFKILVPQNEADTVMLYELYSSTEPFEAHRTGHRCRRLRRMRQGCRSAQPACFAIPWNEMGRGANWSGRDFVAGSRRPHSTS